MKRLTLFNTYAEYTGASLDLDIPNVTYCKDTPEVVYYKEHCDAVDWYEVSGEVIYPSEIAWNVSAFTMQIPYNHITVSTSCTRTVVAGVDSVVIECGTNQSATAFRTVSGTYVYHGIEIPYSLTQGKYQHEYVEIGGKKWATMNVGAENPWETGLYFQWGDISGYTESQVGSDSGQKYFGWADYKYSDSSGKVTKYKQNDGRKVLEASDDAATVNWGGGWRMPTIDEYVALGKAVNSAWTTNYKYSGVSGLVITDKTDSSKVLFFPITGLFSDGKKIDMTSHGYYWSSTLDGEETTRQRGKWMYFNKTYAYWNSTGTRKYGCAVRAILDA